jgi:hypothetical protein
MKTLLKTLMAAGVLTAAASVSAAPIISISYDPYNAEAAFLASLNGTTVTENFDGLGDADFAQYTGDDQTSWENKSSSFNTAVGTFTLTAAGQDEDHLNYHNDELMIESDVTGEYGRSVLSDFDGDLWLDSNDAQTVTWSLNAPLSGHFNAIGFYLADPTDVSAKFTLTYADGTNSGSLVLAPNGLPNGTLTYVTIVSDKNVVGGTITFHNSTKNDGWGIDDVTVGNVPEPGTLLLMGLGLLGLGAARRRNTK